MKRSGPIRRRKGLAARSTAARDERNAREAVRVQVSQAFGGRCALYTPGWCRRPGGGFWRPGDELDFHEVIRRGQLAGAHLDPRLVIPLCRAHHDLDLRLSVAEQVGIRAPRWALDRYGLEAVVADLARIRAEYLAGRDPAPPIWR